MKNLILTTLIVFLLLLGINYAKAEDQEQEGCKWTVAEETDEYVLENCINEENGNYMARIRQKHSINITTIPADKQSKPLNPIDKYKDKTIVQTPDSVHTDEKISKIKKEVEITAKKIEDTKQEFICTKIDCGNEQIDKKVAEEKRKILEDGVHPHESIIVERKTVKEEVKEETIVKEEKIEETVKEEEKSISWLRLYELLPGLIVENEKVKAAELDYEAAVETLKSEYSAYYPQVTISIGNNWEDDRTPSKGTYPDNTITHDSKQGIQKSITITQMIWDFGRTSSVIDKAKHIAQQAYYRLELTKEDVVMEGINAWLNLTKAYNTYESNKKVEANALITLTMTIEKVKKGEASKLEQLQIEQQYRTFQTLTMTAKLGLDSAIQRFQNVWRHLPHDITNMPTPIADLLGMLPNEGASVVDNTTLKIANLDIKIAQEQVNFDKAEFKPRIDGKLSYTEKDGELSGGYDTHDAQKEEYRADITLTWKLFGGFKTKHLHSADMAKVRAALVRYDDVKRTTNEQFKNAWNNYVLVEKNLEVLKRTMEINEEMYMLTLQDFKAGNSPLMAVFGMKTAHIMSEVAYANAQIDLLITRFQLHKVLGLVDPILK